MASNEEQTCPRPEDVEEAPTQILETHGVSTLVHEMKVDGYHLVERKQKTNVNPEASDDKPKMTIIIHSRSIDDRSYDVQETLTEGMDEPDRVIETEMTPEETENPLGGYGRTISHVIIGLKTTSVFKVMSKMNYRPTRK